MPALQNTDTDHCTKLNRTGYPSLWFPSDSSTAAPLIATAGVPKTFKTSLPSSLSSPILGNQADVASSTLLQFLKGQGVGNQAGVDYSKMENVLLKNTSGYKSIVDDYIATKSSGPYTFSTKSAPKISSDKFEAITTELQTAEFLLKDTEIYNASDFDPANTSPKTSLVYLNSIANPSTGVITDASLQDKKAKLEARNLRFFGAWLAEYCFYRCRYDWLLNKFFKIYKKTAPPYYETELSELFSQAGVSASATNPTSPATSIPTQAECLRCLTFHMACLNTRMTDMRLLLGKISEKYSALTNTIQTAINTSSNIGSNQDLRNKITALNESAMNMQNYLTEKDFHDGVVKYTSEKNRYANILLGFYAFLNIAAVAMIIQMRSS
jgi:hypothetical protein